jgi:multiple antibiotic resistance protein
MITGPATISTAIILADSYGVLTTSLAGAAALLLTFIILIFAPHIDRLAGRGGVRIMSTMMGIITIAWGLQFLLTGVNAFKPA